MLSMFKNLLNQNTFKLICTFMIIYGIGLQVRLYPLQHYTPEIYNERATLYVVSKLKEKIAETIHQQYPGITPTEKNFLNKKMFDEIFHRERDNLRKNISIIRKELAKEDHNTKKYPYLLASDSYYYLYLTQQLIETGRISDQIKGSKYFHKLMFAPQGFWEPITLHPYLGYMVYTVMKFFDPSISLMAAVSFANIGLMGLILFVFLILCRTLSFSWLSTFIGSVFFILAPIYVKRSVFAWYDNDGYNILFPLLTSLFFWLGFKNLNRPKYLLAFSILTALSLCLYSFFWQGWIFLLSIIFISSCAVIIFQRFYLKDARLGSHASKFAGLFFFMTILLITLAFGIKDFLELFKDGWKALSNFLTPQLSIWPDLYISVGELHKASWQTMIELTGGYFVFAFAIFGIVAAIFHSIKKNESRYPILITLTIFFILSIKLTLGAQRFALLCIVPAALLFIYGLENFISLTKKMIATLFQKLSNHSVNQGINLGVTCLLLSTIIFPIKHINQSIESLLNPIYNDTWDRTLSFIKNNTPENSIVNTWWPPGHFIKAMANRQVTFDGATINVPQAYWMLNVFSSTTEKESLGLLRMLNISGNQAAEFLTKLGLSTSSSVQLLKQITLLDDLRAKILLRHTLKDAAQADELLTLTHQTPPPSYCLIYNEFAENSLEMGVFGRWNFKRIEEINSSPELQKHIPAQNSKDYIKFLWDLSGGSIRHSPKLSQINQINDIAMFDEKLQIDLKKMEASIDSPKYGQGIPLSIFYLSDNQVVEKIQLNANLPYSVVYFPDHYAQSAILLDRTLAQSIMTRLFYFRGKGLKYFELVSDISDVTKRTHILVFKIKWDEFERDLRSE